MRRRTFVRNTAAAVTATALFPAFSCSKRAAHTGLILYTVRGEMASNPEGTLDTVASLGFNWIEAADYSDGLFYGMKPAVFRRMVEARGMSLISSHNGLDELNLDRVTGDAAEAGLRYVVIPSLPGSTFESVDSVMRAAEFLNRAGERCRELGMKAGFHNHRIEFAEVDGIIPFNLFLENTDPALVSFELDLAWITAAGADPLEYFNKYPGRFELWHVKDLSTELEDATLGEGTIDFAPIFRKAGEAGMQYFFIEQDNCYTHTPIESIEISRNYLLNNIL